MIQMFYLSIANKSKLSDQFNGLMKTTKHDGSTSGPVDWEEKNIRCP